MPNPLRRATPRRIGVAAILALALASSAAATETFFLGANPVSGPAGSTTVLSASGLSPGGYTMSVYWDGIFVENFTMPLGDSFAHSFTTPSSASTGYHTITVCLSCGDVEFEVTGSFAFYVNATGGGGEDFDAQVLAMELTQGVRGDLQLRDVVSGAPVIPDDGSVHVMNRRTVVRVYPWIDLDPGATAQPLGCELRGFRDGAELPGSPLQPVNPLVSEIDESWTLEEMRVDPSRSWNFVLPMDWVKHSTVPGEENDPIYVTLNATVNPSGLYFVPERPGANLNNVAQLISQEFVHVTGDRSTPFRIFPILIDFLDTSDPSMPVLKPAPPMGQVLASLQTVAVALPVPAGNSARSNMLLMPARWDSYEGTLSTDGGKRKFRRTMVRRHFPSGDFHRPERGDYYTFLFERGGGFAFLKSAFVMSAAVGWTLTHEFVHAIGQEHAANGHGEGDGGGYDTSYPGSHGQVEANAFGFNVYAMTARPPSAPEAPEGIVHDYMSYAGDPTWTSLYQWQRVAEHLDAPQISPKSDLLVAHKKLGPSLILSGLAHAAGCELDPIFETAEPEPLVSPSLTPYSLQFKDGGGALLLEQQLVDDLGMDLGVATGHDFVAVASPPAGWASVAIAESGVVLQEFTRSPNAPTVSLLSPISNELWPATGTVSASWLASDADFDPLTFRLEGSVDGGKWFAIAEETGSSLVDVDMAQIPAGAGPLWVRVQASDGLHVAVSNSVQVTLQARPPFAYLVHPADEATFLVDQPVPLFGLASDWQDGDLGPASLNWIVDGSWVTNGNEHELTQLQPGLHTIELVAYNSLQLAGQMSVTIKVVAALSAPTLELPVGGSSGVPTNVDFGWSAPAVANGYRLQLSLDGQFQQIVLDAGGLTEPSYRLGGLDPQTTYYWRVRPQSVVGLGPWSNQSWFTTGYVTATDPQTTPRPWGFRLDAPAPNPFNPRTTLSFTLEHDAHVNLDVFDLRGRRITRLAQGQWPAGEHRVTWDGSDDQGQAVASGTYFARLSVRGEGTQIQKMTLLK